MLYAARARGMYRKFGAEAIFLPRLELQCRLMHTADFDFDLPEKLIAQHPLPERDASRMMLLDRATGTIRHLRFRDLPGLLAAGDLLVFNDTRVLPARLLGRRDTGAAIEALLIYEKEDGDWVALVRKAGRIKAGETLRFEDDALAALAVEQGPDGKWRLRFQCPDLRAELRRLGRAPLPPYIRREREDSFRDEDLHRYQTVMASADGAVAAPTAGLHFTPETFAALKRGGVSTAALTLHVGEGTFQPVKTEDLDGHKMHTESFDLGAATAAAVNDTRAVGGRVVSVGTTTLRCLESVARGGLPISAQAGDTDIFIYPPYRFQAVTALLTNFHLPRSTLLMLVSAFAGTELTREAYRQALAEEYRFYSYGDCMLIL